jgi:antitoxin PrlF
MDNGCIRGLVSREVPLITSRVTSNGRTTIPSKVRETLNLKAGDRVAYEIEDGRVVLTLVGATQPVEDPFAVFSEWGSEADRRAYADL